MDGRRASANVSINNVFVGDEVTESVLQNLNITKTVFLSKKRKRSICLLKKDP